MEVPATAAESMKCLLEIVLFFICQLIIEEQVCAVNGKAAAQIIEFRAARQPHIAAEISVHRIFPQFLLSYLAHSGS